MPKANDKKDKRKKACNRDEIAKSSQLVQKSKKKRTTRRAVHKKNDEQKVCSNSLPLPAFSELELLYEESHDEDTSATSTVVSPPKELEINPPDPKPIEITTELDHIPTLAVVKEEDSRVLSMLDNIIILDDDDGPQSPVVPARKRKTCSSSPNKGKKSKETLDLDESSSSEILPPKCKNKCILSCSHTSHSNTINCSTSEKNDSTKNHNNIDCNKHKSIFNPIAVAVKLKESGKDTSSSPGSDGTVDYEYTEGTSPEVPILSTQSTRAFSPLPSTSKDNETIMKNEQRFNESLQSEVINDSSQDEVEVIEQPTETIFIDDSVSNNSIPTTHQSSEQYADDDCVFVPSGDTEVSKKNDSVIIIDNKDDIYASIDLTSFSTPHLQIIDDEIIDVDDIIAENNAVLQKYNREEELNTITLVEPSITSVQASEEVSNTNSSSVNNTTTPEPTPVGDENIPPVLVEQTNVYSPSPPVTNYYPSNTRNQDTNSNDLLRSQLDGEMGHENFFMYLENFMSIYDVSRHRRRNSGSRRHRVRNNGRHPIVPASSTQQNPAVTTPPSIPVIQPSQSVQSPEKQNDSSQNTESNQRSLGDCPICMDSLSKSTVASTLCGHLFCMDCIKAAIRVNGKRCPTCRKVLKGAGGGYHQIFL